jgi:hypothetical protein
MGRRLYLARRKHLKKKEVPGKKELSGGGGEKNKNSH